MKSGYPTIGSVKFFSNIDCYHQVSIETDVWNTNFKSNKCLFEWLVMPFVLTNSTTTFMRMMDDILQPFTNSFVVVYLDGILIFNKTWEEHLEHIQQVLGTLRQHKLYAMEKCSFGMQRIQYLGYIVDEQGVHVDPTKIQVIRDSSFLGLANFYRASWALDLCWGLSYHLGPKIGDQGWREGQVCVVRTPTKSIQGSEISPLLNTNPHSSRPTMSI
jgi:hypothetical protein